MDTNDITSGNFAYQALLKNRAWGRGYTIHRVQSSIGNDQGMLWEHRLDYYGLLNFFGYGKHLSTCKTRSKVIFDLNF